MMLFGLEIADRLASEHPQHFPVVLSDRDNQLIASCSSEEHPVLTFSLKPGMTLVYQSVVPHCRTNMEPNTMYSRGKVLTYSTLHCIVEGSTELVYVGNVNAYYYAAFILHALFKTVSA